MHPDKKGIDKSSEKFKKITDAYNILSNPQVKREYDECREAQSSEGFQGWGSTGYKHHHA